MDDLRAYECLLEDVSWYESVSDSYGEYLGSIPEEGDLYGIYYATTPGKARYMFIRDYINKGILDEVDFNQPIKTRLLAKNVTETNHWTEDPEDADWLKADLTKYGKRIADEWKCGMEWAAEQIGNTDY